MVPRVLAMVALSLFCASSAIALSIVTRVTPSNIGNQPFVISVIGKHLQEYESIRFEVTVSARSGALRGGRSGELSIWKEEAAARSALNQLGSRLKRAPLLVSCAVQEEAEKSGVRYVFTVHDTLIRKASFLVVLGVEGMPAFDGYELLPADFVER